MDKRIPVAVLGATGAVGQLVIKLLENHPLFEVTELCASESRTGRLWIEQTASSPVLEGWTSCECKNIRLKNPFELSSRLVFSALPSNAAEVIEQKLADRGHIICSNASTFRMHKNVPLILPEVNYPDIKLMNKQDWPGKIITNPNCVVTGLALCLAPLHRQFGISSLSVTTMQAASGAGFPGISSLSLFDNVIPYISGEEPKIAEETHKILNSVFPSSISCYRVPVRHGHTFDVSLNAEHSVTVESISESLENFSPLYSLDLPSAPQKPIVVFHDNNRPQPLMDLENGRGMSVSVGRIRKGFNNEIRFTGFVNNLKRGAAGAAVLNAELLINSLPREIFLSIDEEIPEIQIDRVAINSNFP